MRKKQTDLGAQTMWKKSLVRFENYQKYIDSKQDRYYLDIIDLLYISNFKGGNATIGGKEEEIASKLLPYSIKLKDIKATFADSKLSDLTETKVKILCKKVDLICSLTKKGSDTKIDGFSNSYLSALLSAYFPDLIPILDRRVLINLKLVRNENIDSQEQIIDIFEFYKPLIEKVAKLSRERGKSLREIDKKEFVKKIIRKKE